MAFPFIKGFIQCCACLILLVSTSMDLSGQEVSRWIVGYKMEAKPQLQQLKSNALVLASEPIFEDLNIWLISANAKDDPAISQMLASHKDVRYYHKDFLAQKRLIPNDPDFPAQWAMTQIGMDKVWDITTGGKTPSGDDIVVAIFDDGYQVDHPDYAANVWTNKNEIPNNGIDDDNNGYVDDFNGWNSTNDNDIHGNERHGTAVAGIIGAVGNNQNQIAGMNWDVKLMLTSGGRQSGTNIGDIVKAYQYIYTQRKIYNDSNGALGAYVVASNYSGGASNRFPSDAPAWCEIFDALGSVGVLNIGSTANSDVDVEVEGDLPSLCPSDFLLVITNTDRLDRKVGPAGYGAISVDLGAPGDDVITTDIGSSLDLAFFGTSAAAPHAAGAVSILYSLICPEAFATSLTDPSVLALQMKSAIMNSVTPSPNLSGISVSGGRLNVLAAVEIINESAIGNCCEITLTDLNTQDESCIGSEDAQIIAQATGKDLVGDIQYKITSNSYEDMNRLGNFTRIPGGSYTLLIEDDMEPQCKFDTLINIPEGIDECPFGAFEITGIRSQNIGDRITVEYSLDEQKDVQVQVHNSLGQLMYTQTVRPDLVGARTHEIFTADWAAGVYHASILATGFRDVESFYVIH